MGIIVALLMGGLMGWLASKVMNRNAQMGITLNVIVGCIGSMLGRFLFGGILGGRGLREDAFDITTLLTSFVGAIILLALVNVIQRGQIR